MDDRELDKLLDQVRRDWRVPPDPPLDEIWSGVADTAFRARQRRSPGWLVVGIAAAAALVVGVFGGRYSVSHGEHSAGTAAAQPVAPAVTASVVDPDHRAMSELLGRTSVLLAALSNETSAPGINPQVTTESARLLTTTRMLLDSPTMSDARLRSLLQDLELILAQVARLEPRHHRTDLQFIQAALDEHDIVPRLRSAAADLSLDDF